MLASRAKPRRAMKESRLRGLSKTFRMAPFLQVESSNMMQDAASSNTFWTKKKVETRGCRICPACCLSETPNCFSFCLQCHGLLISHGIRPIVFEIIDDETDAEEETKRQLEEQIKKEEEAIFHKKRSIRPKERQKRNQIANMVLNGFDPDEVDFGDEQDDEMETSEKGDDEVAMEVDEKDDEERAEAGKTSLDKLQEWAHNLDPSCKKIPTGGLINCDADETAAQIIDNAIMANIILLHGHYHNNRVNRTPEEYHKDMVENQMGPNGSWWHLPLRWRK